MTPARGATQSSRRLAAPDATPGPPGALDGSAGAPGGPLGFLLSSLQPVQRAAVLAEEPVVCVVAGAGTGKTRVLTLRVARRVHDRSADPARVLVCTFSRRAAEELRDRLWSLDVGPDVRAGTFHRTALALIRQYRADHDQRPPTVLAERRSVLAELSKDDRRRPATAARGATSADVRRVDGEISWAKARLVGPEGYEAAAAAAGRRPGVRPERVAGLYARYEAARERRGALDLDDLLSHCGALLESDPSFAEAVRWRNRHVFVDELQDLNEAQFRLLRLLVGDDPDLFAVGDPNQSVYGWNGADPGLLDRLVDTYAGTRVLRLEANHRCSPQVVRAAAAALGTTGGGPVSAREDGPAPRVVALDTDAAEAAWVARQVWLAHRPGRRWSSMAVLARTNAQLRTLAAALAAERVPHRIAGADVSPASDVSPAQGVASEVEELRAAELRATEAPAGAGVADETIRAASAAATGGVTTGAVPLDAGTDAVALSTFHRAKGLQWRTVFVVGLSEGFVPLVSARDRAAKAEERRLLYVALTRAEQELTCTWARRSDAQATGTSERSPCPWLGAVEETVAAVAHGEADAGPAQALEHLSAIRASLERAGGGGARR